MLNKMKIKSRLLFAFFIIIAFALIITAIGVAGLRRSYDDLDHFINREYQADNAIKMCRIEVNNAARAIRDMYIDPDAENHSSYREKVDTSIGSLDAHLQTLEENYSADDGLVAQYKTAILDWVDIGNRALDNLDQGNAAEVQQILTNECTPALQQVVSLSKELTDSTQQMQQDILNKNIAETNMATVAILTMLALTIGLGILLSLKITNGIVKPLAEVGGAAAGMAKGDLKQSIAYTSHDAVGEMADSMRSSIVTLGSYVSDIDRAMSQMAQGDFNLQASEPFIGDFKGIEDSIDSFLTTISITFSEIRNAADQVSDSSDQISTGAQALSQGASEQASSVEELAATISAISKQVQETAGNADTARDQTIQASDEVTACDRQMRDMISSMNEISNKSHEIEKIIKTIEDIAFQTNILALNAAVEAARAGEAGKGFAVVADEVRNLASKSAEASKNTAALIEDSLSAVNKGTKMAGETASSLYRVVDSTRAVTETVDKIAEAADQQAASVNQITQGIELISGVIQTNSATAEESAAASQELTGQAQRLKHLISRFKLRNTH